MDVDSSDSEANEAFRKKDKRKRVRKRKGETLSGGDEPRTTSATSNNPMPPPEKRDKKKKKKSPPKPHTEHESESDMPLSSSVTSPVSSAALSRDMKARSENLCGSVMSHLHSPGNGINGQTAEFVLGKFFELQAVLNDVLIRNSHLEGQIEALKGETEQQRRTFEPSIDKARSNPAAAAASASRGPLTYAERVGLRSKVALASNQKRDPPNVIIIKPEDVAEFASSDATKEAVQKMISPAREGLQVVNVRKIQGNGILVETAKKSDVTAIMDNEKLRAAGLVVGAPQRRSPRVILHSTPRMSSDDVLLQTIVEQNVEIEDRTRIKQQMRVAFRSGSKTGRRLGG